MDVVADVKQSVKTEPRRVPRWLGAVLLLGLANLGAWLYWQHLKSMGPWLPPTQTQVLTAHPLTQADLVEGKRNVRQMLIDRPQMRAWTTPGDRLFRWTVHQFAGEIVGSKISWTAYPPRDGAIYWTRRPSQYGPAFLGLADRYGTGPQRGRPVPGELLWLSLVHEMFNLAGTPDANAVESAVPTGALPRAGFIEEASRLDYRCWQRTQSFYRAFWLPWARQHRRTPHPDWWGATTPPTYEAWIAQYRRSGAGYPDRYYSIYFDNLAPRFSNPEDPLR